MAATKPHIHEHFQQIIWYSLDNNLVSNAVFVAERLLALNDRDQNSRHLLGLCLLRAGRASSSYNITNGHRHLGCAYVFAQSCKELGKYREGLLSLETCLNQLPNKWTACEHPSPYHILNGDRRSQQLQTKSLTRYGCGLVSTGAFA